MQEESETSYDGEVVETYVPDDRSISEFHGSSLDKKLRVIKLGLYFLKEGNLKNQAWDNEQWQQKIDTLKEKHRIEAQECATSFLPVKKSLFGNSDQMIFNCKNVLMQ